MAMLRAQKDLNSHTSKQLAVSDEQKKDMQQLSSSVVATIKSKEMKNSKEVEEERNQERMDLQRAEKSLKKYNVCIGVHVLYACICMHAIMRGCCMAGLI